MAPSHLSRRRFLRGLSVGAGALVSPFLEREAVADAGTASPLRLLVIQTPDGRPGELWKPSGTGSTFSLTDTMRPFASVKSQMVLLEGINHLAGFGESHCQAFVQWMTGMAGTTTDNYTAAHAPSVDQIVAADPAFVGQTRFRSLQLAGDMTTLAIDVSHRYMSWAGPNQPLPSSHRPLQNYARIFEGFSPSGSADPQARAALERLIRNRRSVLDLVLKSDGKRMAAVVTLAQKANFESHLESIRALERKLSEMGTAQCRAPQSSTYPGDGVDSRTAFPSFWTANLEILRLSMVCDLSRVATFISSPSTSNLVHFDWAPGMRSRDNHHGATHAGDMQNLRAINLWYTERIAEFITALQATPDGSGSLLDNMLVVYGSEFGSTGSHSTTNIPFVLFGKAGGRLQTGRSLSYLAAPRSSNDLWLSVLQLLNMPRNSIGDASKCKGPLPGLA